MLYYEQGKYEQAESLLQRALAIREQQLGPEYPNTKQSLDLLSELHQSHSEREQPVELECPSTIQSPDLLEGLLLTARFA